MRDRRTAIVAVFVLSGASGLIYEVVWSRQLALVFGNTTQAIAAILTGYFGGMAIGSLVGGRVADRVRSPLRLYGALELLLVAVVLATPLLFSLIRSVHGSAYSSLADQPALLAGIGFVLSAGTGVLHSREFYAAAARRLNAGGVMTEWIPGGQRLDEFMAHARTLADVFPEVALAFGPGGYGVFMLGSDRTVTLRPEAIRSVLERPGVIDNLSMAPDFPAHDSATWSQLIPSLLFATGDTVRSGVAPGPIITDDHP